MVRLKLGYTVISSEGSEVDFTVHYNVSPFSPITEKPEPDGLDMKTSLLFSVIAWLWIPFDTWHSTI